MWLSVCSNSNWNAVAASVGGNAMASAPPQDTSRFSRLLLQPTFHLLFVVQLLFGTSIIWQILQEWQTIYLQTLSNYKFSLTFRQSPSPPTICVYDIKQADYLLVAN